LGIGSSSDVIVERWNGIAFAKPLSRVREAVEALRPVLAGERGQGGFRLESPPAQPVPMVIAALRDRMLGLGGEIGDGTFVNFLPISAVPHVGERIDPRVSSWRAGDRQAALERAPEDLMREIFIFGSPDEQRARLDEFAEAGITTFSLSPFCGPDELPGFVDALARR